MKITDLSVKRPVTVVVVCLALAVLGVFSLGRLAIDLIPDISFPVILIYTSYPGVSPEEVEENLTKTIETAATSSRWIARPALLPTTTPRISSGELNLPSVRREYLRAPSTTEPPVTFRFSARSRPTTRSMVRP